MNFRMIFFLNISKVRIEGTHLMETSYGKIALPEAPILLKVLKGGLNWLGTFVVSTADRTNVL